MSIVITETERLILRELAADDAEALQAMNSNPDVLRYVLHPEPWTRDKAVAFISGFDHYDRYGLGRWAVAEKNSGKFIGLCGLKKRPEIPLVDLGYRFLPEYWGNGFATEAAAASVRYGFDVLGLPEIYASYIPGNKASARVMEKIGMKPADFKGIRDDLNFTVIKNPADTSANFDPVIETERLILRKMLPADARTMFALNSDPEVLRYTGDDPFDSLAAAHEFLVNYQEVYSKYGFARWTVILKETLETLGWCGLRQYDKNDPVDLGYRFFRRHWNKGYATESSQACIDYGFEKLGFDRIIARANAANTGSTRVMEKCGMKFFSREQDENACGDTVYYEISR